MKDRENEGGVKRGGKKRRKEQLKIEDNETSESFMLKRTEIGVTPIAYFLRKPFKPFPNCLCE